MKAAGLNINARNRKGKTVADLAEENGHVNIAMGVTYTFKQKIEPGLDHHQHSNRFAFGSENGGNVFTWLREDKYVLTDWYCRCRGHCIVALDPDWHLNSCFEGDFEDSHDLPTYKILQYAPS